MKKLLLPVVLLWTVLLLVWCSDQSVLTSSPSDGSTNETVLDETSSKTRDEFNAEEKMNIHMCLMWWWENCDEIFNKDNKNIYSDAIAEQCDLMPWMEHCNEYFNTETQVVTNAFNMQPDPTAVEAWTAEIVELQDWDAYTITIEEVVKTINWKQLRMLAYNGTIPWPVLKAPKGSKIDLTVVNMVDDIETTVHHHGLRHDDRYDWVPIDMWWYDEPISKGETLEYVLEFPDSGLFRYHPHVREDLQQEMWLYWNYLVEDPLEKDVKQTNSEKIIMFDDIFLNEDGAIVPFDKDKWTYVVMWRFGNTPLVNWDTNFEMSLIAWEVARLYLTNVANVTPFNLTIPGVQMKLVWGDIGKYEREELIDNLVISPAERYIVDIFAPEPWTYSITNTMKEWSYSLWTIKVEEWALDSSYAEQFATLRSNEWIIADIDQYRQYFDIPVNKTLNLSVEMDGMMWEMPEADHPHNDWDTDHIQLPWWLTLDPYSIEREDEMPVMNEASTTDNTRWYLVDDATGERNMDIKWTFNQWDVVKIRIFNDPNSVHPMQHPVHFHGQRFLVLNKNWQLNENLVWKDTVLVPTGEYVDILLDVSNPGKWMVHCHIAEHLTAWMMMSFSVEE